MKQYLNIFLMTSLIAVSTVISLAEEGWETYEAKEYGFSMLIPEGTEMVTKEWSDGWGGLLGTYDGVSVFGAAKLGAQENAEAIEKFAVTLTGIPDSEWTEIDKGSGDGWTWYSTVQAKQGDKHVFGGYGVGPKGSYLLILVTTPADFEEYREDYDKWYNSIQLH